MPTLCAEVRRARPLLGTFVEIAVAGVEEEAAHEVIGRAFAEMEEVQRRMSFHEEASVLSQLNRDAAREPVEVDLWTWEVLETAKEVHRVSGGIFDLSIARPLQRLGFLPVGRTIAARGAASLGDVHLHAGRLVSFANPEVLLDLGGIAKGYAVDRAIAVLEEGGVPGALVNAGGDLRAMGEGSFPISLRHPEYPGGALGPLKLHQGALASSAHTFADRVMEGATTGPIVDPRTGECTSRLLSATVWARSAMVADALTKVVMLLGEDSLPVLEHYEAHAIFLAPDGQMVCSSGWHAAFHL